MNSKVISVPVHHLNLLDIIGADESVLFSSCTDFISNEQRFIECNEVIKASTFVKII